MRIRDLPHFDTEFADALTPVMYNQDRLWRTFDAVAW